MLLIAAAALASTPQDFSPTRVAATVQARAIVRIIPAVTLRLGEGPLSGDAPLARLTMVHAEGQAHAARLIEFQ